MHVPSEEILHLKHSDIDIYFENDKKNICLFEKIKRNQPLL